MAGLDMDNRDPNNLGEHIQVRLKIYFFDSFRFIYPAQIFRMRNFFRFAEILRRGEGGPKGKGTAEIGCGNCMPLILKYFYFFFRF